MLRKRNIALDLLKFLMATMVVFAHCGFLFDVSPVLGYMSLNGVFRLTVPVFFMINGFYFNPTKGTQSFKKWFFRVFILYALWMLIYSFIWVKNSQENLFVNLFFGWHHLWYVVALLFSGLMLYVLRKVRLNYLLLLSVFLFLIGTSFQYFIKYKLINVPEFLNTSHTYKNFLFFGFPFFALGFFIRQRREVFVFKRNVISVWLFFGFVLLLIESYFNYRTMKPQQGVDLMFSQMFLCAAIFLGTFQFKETTGLKGKLISQYSSAIYFVHTIPMLYLQIWFQIKYSVLSIITLLVSIIVSFLLIKANKKVKYLL